MSSSQGGESKSGHSGSTGSGGRGHSEKGKGNKGRSSDKGYHERGGSVKPTPTASGPSNQPRDALRTHNTDAGSSLRYGSYLGSGQNADDSFQPGHDQSYDDDEKDDGYCVAGGSDLAALLEGDDDFGFDCGSSPHDSSSHKDQDDSGNPEGGYKPRTPRGAEKKKNPNKGGPRNFWSSHQGPGPAY